MTPVKSAVKSITFSNQMVDRAWQRSGGFCECAWPLHMHEGRCNRVLFKFLKGDLTSEWGWEVHSKTGGYKTLSDSEVLCTHCYNVRVSQETADTAAPANQKKRK